MFTKPIIAMFAAVTLGTAAVPAAAEAQGWMAKPASWNAGSGWDDLREDVRYRRDDRRYHANRKYRGNNRCYDKGNGGLAIGAVGGGLLGNAVAGRGDRTLGTVLGAGIGALAGRSIDRSDGRRC